MKKSVKIMFCCLVSALLLSAYSARHLLKNHGREPESNNVMFEINEDSILNSIQICTELMPPPDTAAFLTKYYWDASHRDLSVMFLDGDPLIQKKVMETAKEWEKHCGIRFKFGNVPDPDITISFAQAGFWSYIGTYCKQKRPSMNLGWLNQNTSQEEYNRVVLHEFGHALGYIHEHQSPQSNILWYDIVVYKYYMLPPYKWSKKEVDDNIFKKYSRDQINATAFDPKSIMLYAIPRELTTNGFSTEANSTLSATDKKSIGEIYPQR